MTTINDILHLANSSVQVNRKALEVVGNNISNVNTPGYTRQRLVVEPQTVVGAWGNAYVGVKGENVERVYNNFLDQQAALQKQRYGFLEGRQNVAKQIEATYDELEGRGISTALGEFFTSFSGLAGDADSLAERQNVVQKSQVLVNHINATYNSLKNLTSDLNMDIEADVGEANTLLSEIADLNDRIIQAGGMENGDVAQLLDQRELKARELAEIIPSNTYIDRKGNLNVLWKGHTLVDGVNAAEFSTIPGSAYGLQLTYGNSIPLDVTDQMAQDSGGKLAGLLYAREVDIANAMSDLDNFAYTLAQQINGLHSTGYALDGSTGRNFFNAITTVEGAAGQLSINQEIVDDPSLIAAAQDSAGLPGDNRIALAISDMQADQSTFGNATFGEEFSLMMGRISREINSLDKDVELQEMVMLQSENFRQSVSGVSLDEEMVSLIQWQRAFEASAKMISAVDSMMATILELK
mgnify:CR=1 FL=1